MSDRPSGCVTSHALTFAFPLADDRWRVVRGQAHVRGGRLWAVEVPGLGRRAADGPGLTAFFYVAHRRHGTRGSVARWEVEDGAVTRTDEAAADAELVE